MIVDKVYYKYEYLYGKKYDVYFQDVFTIRDYNFKDIENVEDVLLIAKQLAIESKRYHEDYKEFITHINNLIRQYKLEKIGIECTHQEEKL